MGSLFWDVPVELDEHEEKVVARLRRTGRLFRFLRLHRHELFDEAFQEELGRMYSEKRRGAPKPPAMLAMVTLLQAYQQLSDADAVEAAVFDARWRLVLGLEADVAEPAFSQGALVDFRARLIRHDMDRRLVERTVELARETRDFGAAQLRVALDSAPLWGAGRVEDTFNLIAHAAELVIACAARMLEFEPEQVVTAAGLQLLGGSSIKAALDIDWSVEAEQKEALERLLAEIGRLKSWLDSRIDEEARGEELLAALATLEQVIAQDIEPDPDGDGPRIKPYTSKDRRISIADGDMRHGRKSTSRTINGYKRHVAMDLDSGLILAAAVRPANQAEYVAMDEDLRPRIETYGAVGELHVDRGYLAGSWIAELDSAGARVVSKAWDVSRGGRFSKAEFEIDLDAGLVTCPGGETARIRGDKAQFSRKSCGACDLRERCTKAANRSLTIHPQEHLLLRFRGDQKTSAGRAARRERVAVEHKLAHVTYRQGMRARYLGQRKNLFDTRRACAVTNLNTIDRLSEAA